MNEPIIVGLVSAAATVAAAIIAPVTSYLMTRAERRPNPPPEASNIANDAFPVSSDVEARKHQLDSQQVSATLIFPGSSQFRAEDYDRGETNITVSHSAIKVLVDAEEVGQGDGEKGFRVNFKEELGRHTVVFIWTGERESWRSERGFRRLEDRSGREELILWFVKPGECKIHLTKALRIAYIEPALIIPDRVEVLKDQLVMLRWWLIRIAVVTAITAVVLHLRG